MDAISPEFRLDPTGTGSFIWRDWTIDDDQEISFHQPTRAVFSIYPAPDATDLASISIYQFRARLTHVCDGFPVPDDLATLAAPMSPLASGPSIAADFHNGPYRSFLTAPRASGTPSAADFPKTPRNR